PLPDRGYAGIISGSGRGDLPGYRIHSVFYCWVTILDEAEQDFYPERGFGRAAMSGPAVIAAVLLAVMLFLILRSWRKGRSSPSPRLEHEKASVLPAPAPPAESFTQTLNRLSSQLAPLAEKTAHPRELTELPEFQIVVDAFRRPQVSLALLRQYMFGDNWPL